MQKHGDCNVPSKQGALGNWVNHQRNFFKKGKLAKERTIQLESIGFHWGTQIKYKKVMRGEIQGADCLQREEQQLQCSSKPRCIGELDGNSTHSL